MRRGYFPLILIAGILSVVTSEGLRISAVSAQTPLYVAQSLDSIESARTFQRSLNLARQAAEKANGGIIKYRAEPAMYGIGNPNVVDNGDTWTFSFKGGEPGSSVMTIESVVTVSKDGQRISIDYNGPVR